MNGERIPDVAPERRLPPITALSVAVIVLVVCGGIYLAATFPGSPSLVPAAGLLAAAALCLLATLVALRRLRDFAWWRFRQVFGWTLLAYAVIAGMIEYVFVLDGTRGGPLVVLTLMLLIYAVNIPLLLAFTVARYEDAASAPGH